jgi:cytochrome b
MGQRTHVREAVAQAHEAPGLDPAVGLLLAAVLVLLALAMGTGLYLVLPAL